MPLDAALGEELLYPIGCTAFVADAGCSLVEVSTRRCLNATDGETRRADFASTTLDFCPFRFDFSL